MKRRFCYEIQSRMESEDWKQVVFCSLNAKSKDIFRTAALIAEISGHDVRILEIDQRTGINQYYDLAGCRL